MPARMKWTTPGEALELMAVADNQLDEVGNGEERGDTPGTYTLRGCFVRRSTTGEIVVQVRFDVHVVKYTRAHNHHIRHFPYQFVHSQLEHVPSTSIHRNTQFEHDPRSDASKAKSRCSPRPRHRVGR